MLWQACTMASPYICTCVSNPSYYLSYWTWTVMDRLQLLLKLASTENSQPKAHRIIILISCDRTARPCMGTCWLLPPLHTSVLPRLVFKWQHLLALVLQLRNRSLKRQEIDHAVPPYLTVHIGNMGTSKVLDKKRWWYLLFPAVKVLQHLNTISPTINFTAKQKDCQLPFLDVLLDEKGGWNPREKCL